MSELSDQIKANAAKAKSMTADGVSVERQPIQDQIAADQYTQPVSQQKVRNRQYRHGRVGF